MTEEIQTTILYSTADYTHIYPEVKEKILQFSQVISGYF